MNRRNALPKAPLILLGIMVAITAVQSVLPWYWNRDIFAFLGCALFYEGEFVPVRLYTLVTAIFVHSGWFHLLANGIWLFILGPMVHSRTGAVRFTLFFVLTGVTGNLAHALVNWGQLSLVIGASGSVFGLLGAAAYVVTRSRSGGPPRTKNILHYIAVVLALMAGYTLLSEDAGISWEAHLGGFAAGLALFPALRQRGDGPVPPPADLRQD